MRILNYSYYSNINKSLSTLDQNPYQQISATKIRRQNKGES